MISWIVAIGVLVGMADSLTGNHFKIGETFQRGFMQKLRITRIRTNFVGHCSDRS